MQIKVWDFAIRLFHWTLVGLLVATIIIAKQENLDLHMVIGEIILGLLIFRIFWGLWGSDTAKFVNFFPTPAKIKHHLDMIRGKIPYEPTIGHNPLGGLMVIIMLLALFVQIGFGLFSFDQIFTYGPLAHLVDDDQASDMASLHKKWAYVILGLVALHVLAIFYYRRFKGDNLITPMITGSRNVAEGGEQKKSPTSKIMLGIRFFGSAGLAYGLVWYLINKV